MSLNAVEAFRALGDPVRLRMVKMLLASPEVACTTYDEVFPIGKSTISYHVKALKAAGLISIRKEGRYYYYALRRSEIESQLPGLLQALETWPEEAFYSPDQAGRALRLVPDAALGPSSA